MKKSNGGGGARKLLNTDPSKIGRNSKMSTALRRGATDDGAAVTIPSSIGSSSKAAAKGKAGSKAANGSKAAKGKAGSRSEKKAGSSKKKAGSSKKKADSKKKAGSSSSSKKKRVVVPGEAVRTSLKRPRGARGRAAARKGRADDRGAATSSDDGGPASIPAIVAAVPGGRSVSAAAHAAVGAALVGTPRGMRLANRNMVRSSSSSRAATTARHPNAGEVALAAASRRVLETAKKHATKSKGPLFDPSMFAEQRRSDESSSEGEDLPAIFQGGGGNL